MNSVNPVHIAGSGLVSDSLIQAKEKGKANYDNRNRLILCLVFKIFFYKNETKLIIHC